MSWKAIDRQFKIFSGVQAFIIIWGEYASIKANFYLGWDWTMFILAVLMTAALLLFTYYLYFNHRLSAVWAILVWGMQVITIESDFVSWTLSLGIALHLSLNLDDASIRLNLIALPMFLWVTVLTLKQRKLTKTSLGPVPPNVSETVERQ